MAKPVLDQKLVEEILSAFTASEDAPVPSAKLLAALSKVSGMFEASIRQRYTELYQAARDTDDDPFLPPAPRVG